MSVLPSQNFIQIAPNIKLEVLDFGGHGEVILLLAGAGNSAHVFDGFAQNLNAKYRVLALTRRGYGASSQPPTGYDTTTLTEDIRASLDQLGIQRVHLIGHSIAGDEITRFAGKYPERVNRLVYLDAAYDRIALNTILSSFTLPSPPELTMSDLSSLNGIRQYTRRIRGVEIPKAEIAATIRFNSDGSVANAVTPDEIAAQHLAGVEAPNYSMVKARALGIFADAQNPSDIIPWLTPASPAWAANNVFFTQVYRPYLLQQQNKFKTELIGSQSLNITGANHYLFISHAQQVTAAIEQFLTAP
ncbi:alpha/beta fold hydrolase [Deefgea chitinilytica]|uniref:Alpha/beta fold hydrolase n=1 Tax=Deefgea chitinilytica TaxID=570276 RepID=A0ABS2CGX3_9NEIS|nr:alpha/beta fold hydrolase [Deefgea chitinilytica]